MTETPTLLKLPTDSEAANEAWGANCGPIALAALLGKEVEQVRGLFEDWPRYTNPTYMKGVLNRAEVRWTAISRNCPPPDGLGLPPLGLACIQFGGFDHRPIKAQYHHTHWVAVDGPTIADPLAEYLLRLDEWQEFINRYLKDENIGDGTFWVRCAIEVQL